MNATNKSAIVDVIQSQHVNLIFNINVPIWFYLIVGIPFAIFYFSCCICCTYTLCKIQKDETSVSAPCKHNDCDDKNNKGESKIDVITKSLKAASKKSHRSAEKMRKKDDDVESGEGGRTTTGTDQSESELNLKSYMKQIAKSIVFNE